jgi:hypothetical protein
VAAAKAAPGDQEGEGGEVEEEDRRRDTGLVEEKCRKRGIGEVADERRRRDIGEAVRWRNRRCGCGIGGRASTRRRRRGAAAAEAPRRGSEQREWRSCSYAGVLPFSSHHFPVTPSPKHLQKKIESSYYVKKKKKTSNPPFGCWKKHDYVLRY